MSARWTISKVAAALGSDDMAQNQRRTIFVGKSTSSFISSNQL